MHSIDSELSLEIIERMQLAKIGSYKKWKKLVVKIKNKQELSEGEKTYFATFSRIYKKSKITSRGKSIHIKLSEEDEKPKCLLCKENSEFYCNLNDTYFCSNHVVGHDENER